MGWAIRVSLPAMTFLLSWAEEHQPGAIKQHIRIWTASREACSHRDEGQCTVKVVVVKLKLVLQRNYLILSSTIFVFVFQQYNLMVCLDFSLIGYYPKVSLLLAGIANSLADNTESL